MTVETGSYISDFNTSLPAAGDSKGEGDDHIRLVKSWLKATFPNISGALTPTHTELNYVDGVTSAIQDQIDTKAPKAGPTFTGTATFSVLTATGLISGSAGFTISGGAVDLTGASTVAAVTPASSSNGTSVATTEWVRTYAAGVTGGASRAEMFFYGSF